MAMSGDEAVSAVSQTPLVSVEAVEYLLVEDAGYYNNHVFVLKVWMEQEMYKIQRSYASFVQLDYMLRYQYPRSQLPQLPLAGAKSAVKKAPTRRYSVIPGATESTPAGSATGSTSIASNTSEKKKLMKRVDASEGICLKRPPLTQFMKDLLRVPEILVSEVMLTFLDEESIDGIEVEDYNEEMLENIEIDLLLQDEELVTKTVRWETLPYYYYYISL
jgi:hypothetical protein